eukprot:5421531-Prymnesium_polylepis.2
MWPKGGQVSHFATGIPPRHAWKKLRPPVVSRVNPCTARPIGYAESAGQPLLPTSTADQERHRARPMALRQHMHGVRPSGVTECVPAHGEGGFGFWGRRPSPCECASAGGRGGGRPRGQRGRANYVVPCVRARARGAGGDLTVGFAGHTLT